jgi:TonB family protein
MAATSSGVNIQSAPRLFLNSSRDRYGPNGECGDVSVVRTFKPPYGLDQQALAAARRWRFRPGMREGKPVPVLVNLEIAFHIH